MSEIKLCLKEHVNPDKVGLWRCELQIGHEGPHVDNVSHTRWFDNAVWVHPWNDEYGKGMKGTKGFGKEILGFGM